MILIQEILLGKNQDYVTKKGTQIKTLTYSYELSHFYFQYKFSKTLLITELFYMSDLVCINQSNFLIHGGVHFLLHLNCHPHTVFPEISLKIEHSALYERIIRNYNP